MSVVVGNNGKCKDAWSSQSIVDGERASVAKKSHASANGLATAQQEVLQLTRVAFAISAMNLFVLVKAVSIVSCSSTLTAGTPIEK